MKTKFILFCLILLCLSCGKDDENAPNPNAPKKRVTQVVTKQYGYTETAKFVYSGEKVSKIIVTTDNKGKWNIKDPWTTEFVYSDNEVKFWYTNRAFEGEPKYSMTYTLNSDGHITSFKYDTYTDTYTYSNGYLVSIKTEEPIRADGVFVYDKNWNMIQNNYNEKIAYTNTLNIGGLYLCYDDHQGIGYPEYYAKLLGKPSKYLPKTAQDYYDDYEGLYTNHFEYELDSDGYVSVIRGTATVIPVGSSKEVRKPDYDWTETYTYEVIE